MFHLISGFYIGPSIKIDNRRSPMASEHASIQVNPAPSVSLRPLLCLLAIAALLVLTGCAQRAAIPVVERLQPPTEKINTHWVSEGETLYAIAWRYNLDAQQLARANGLDGSSRIYRGQTLRLDTDRALREQRASAARSPAVSRPSERAVARNSAARSATSNTSPKPSANANLNAEPGSWRWPAQGSVLERFSFRRGAGHKGLDIAGRTGQPVHAAHNGLVVYAGDGLPAYGQLLIVKHSEEYLSAYAHNSRLLVREGDRVIAGQKVAEMGRTGTTHEHLHFEIRKRGVPVNPMALLPRRSGLG